MNKQAVIIFGAGKMGETAYNSLKESHDIRFFCDNSAAKWGTRFCGLTVLSPSELPQYINHQIIIASAYYDEIAVQLEALGISDVYVFDCVNVYKTHDIEYALIKARTLKDFSGLHVPKQEDFMQFESDYTKALISVEEPKAHYNVNYKEKNVLIFAYEFPPQGGPGVQRTLKFVKYLGDFGWNPIVITTGVNIALRSDPTLLNDIPYDVSVIRIDHNYQSTEEYDMDKLQEIINLFAGVIKDDMIMRQFLETTIGIGGKRRFLYTPEVKIQWVLSVLKQIGSIIDFCKISVVFCTMGPNCASLIGYYLSAYHKLPWVADFRDEWYFYPGSNHSETYPETVNKVEFELENAVLASATKILVITKGSVANYSAYFNVPDSKMSVITNGFDESDFIGLPVDGTEIYKFVIKHNGPFIFGLRTPFAFIECINEMIYDRLVQKDRFLLECAGEQSSDMTNEINKHDVHGIVRTIAYCPHLESLRNLCESSLLLLVIGDKPEYSRMLTGKLFEYIRMHKRILALAPVGGDADIILRETGTGQAVSLSDKAGIKQFVLNAYNDFMSSRAYGGFNDDEITKYSRRNLTRQLANILDEL